MSVGVTVNKFESKVSVDIVVNVPCVELTKYCVIVQSLSNARLTNSWKVNCVGPFLSSSSII